MQQFHPLKLKPSPHIPSLRLSRQKTLSWAFKVLLEGAFGHFAGTVRKIRLSISSPQTLEGTSNWRGTPRTDPVQNALGTAVAQTDSWTDSQQLPSLPAPKHNLKRLQNGYMQKHHFIKMLSLDLSIILFTFFLNHTHFTLHGMLRIFNLQIWAWNRQLIKGTPAILKKRIWKTKEKKNQWNNSRSQTTTFFRFTLVETLMLIKQPLLKESQIKKTSEQGRWIERSVCFFLTLNFSSCS